MKQFVEKTENRKRTPSAARLKTVGGNRDGVGGLVSLNGTVREGHRRGDESEGLWAFVEAQ